MLCILVSFRSSFFQKFFELICILVLRVIFLDRVGGVLRILGAYKFIDEKALRRFLLTCQSRVYGSLLY